MRTAGGDPPIPLLTAPVIADNLPISRSTWQVKERAASSVTPSYGRHITTSTTGFMCRNFRDIPNHENMIRYVQFNICNMYLSIQHVCVQVIQT
ncbi:hypothetical protein DMENIID0001_106430 [Sergentomyia squamirostris]